MLKRLLLVFTHLIAVLSLAAHANTQNPATMKDSTLKLHAMPLTSSLKRPVGAYFAPGNDKIMFVIEQFSGKIIAQNILTGKQNVNPLLTIHGLSTKNEQGLLGMTFHPNFRKNGYFYVNYTRQDGATVIERYTLKESDNFQVDLETQKIIMIIPQPQWNHNGGWMDFGPDGYLYIAVGDGGAGYDSGKGHTSQSGNGQDITDNLLGKILRVDINSDGFLSDSHKNYAIPATNPFAKNMIGSPEIWVYGLRNTWRASFDSKTGDLYMGDVGQNEYEEVNVLQAGSKGGENYGWKYREGFVRTKGKTGGDKTNGMIDPVYAYRSGISKGEGKSVVGGYVYRGKKIPQLYGHYLFADYVSKGIWSFKYNRQNRTIGEVTDWTKNIRTLDGGKIDSPASFSEDSEGELYITDHAGRVYKLVPEIM